MTLIASEAIVLHAFDYLETSRILRLITRESGLQSVVAKGARRPKSRFGTALDLFAQGMAQFSTRRGRELHTLTAFDVTNARPALAGDFDRFTGAAAIAEMAARFGGDEQHPEVFDAVESAFDALSTASFDDAGERALAGAWRVVGALGFTPALEICASCHADVPLGAPAPFAARAGGILCSRCEPLTKNARTLPADAREALVLWHSGGSARLRDVATARAHQRLLREFVVEHLAEGRQLRAFDAWERERWSA
jgi:DNA repair protein RecO (recombination protein O)